MENDCPQYFSNCTPHSGWVSDRPTTVLGAIFFWSPRRLKTLRRSVSQRRHAEKNAIAKKNWTHFIFDKFFPTLFCIYHWYILLELVFFGNHSQIPLELPPCGENTGGGQIPPIFRVRVSSFRVSSKIRSWNSYCQHRKLMDRARAVHFPAATISKKRGDKKKFWLKLNYFTNFSRSTWMQAFAMLAQTH